MQMNSQILAYVHHINLEIFLSYDCICYIMFLHFDVNYK